VVSPEGFEPPHIGLEDRGNDPLCHGDVVHPGGVEPPAPSFGGSGPRSLGGCELGGADRDRTCQCLGANQVSPHCDLGPVTWWTRRDSNPHFLDATQAASRWQ
jgi:hypothetical protein